MCRTCNTKPTGNSFREKCYLHFWLHIKNENFSPPHCNNMAQGCPATLCCFLRYKSQNRNIEVEGWCEENNIEHYCKHLFHSPLHLTLFFRSQFSVKDFFNCFCVWLSRRFFLLNSSYYFFRITMYQKFVEGNFSRLKFWEFLFCFNNSNCNMQL